MIAVHGCTIKATVNDILREWRDLWPGGLNERAYSTLNLMAHCREGSLGFNHASCRSCDHREWFASSCGDRHCPNCLGPRQAQWSEKVCERLPDCPHFHVVFTVPEQVHEFFESNYRVACAELFGAAAETLSLFQKNNWGVDGGFFGVLHTWGRALNWHPHLHMLVSSGGKERASGKWKQARSNYLFPVKAMSKVFRAIMLRRLELLDGNESIQWPEGLETVEARRDWRVMLAGKGWNIFSRATLGNTRAVVRYLARYTSQIAMSNHRISEVDEEERTVSFDYKDYKDGQKTKTMKLGGKQFIWRFTRHMVPKGFRRVRYFGLLAGGKDRTRKLDGAPLMCIGEKSAGTGRRPCPDCEATDWNYGKFYVHIHIPASGEDLSCCGLGGNRFSLVQLRDGP